MNRPLHHWFAKLRRPSARVQTRAQRRWTCLHPEALEGRALLTTVTSLLDNGTSGTLRQAIVDTPAGGTITFDSTLFSSGLPQTITLSQAPGFGELQINKSLTILGPGADLLRISGSRTSRVFDINPSVNNMSATLDVFKGFTIENGFASPGDGAAGSGGGIRVQGDLASLELDNMVVTSNNATADGGGLVMFNPGDHGQWTLTLNDTTVSGNNAGDAGGGVDTDGAGNVIINNHSTIDRNTDVHQGAGIYVDVPAGTKGDFTGANMTMMDTVVSNNVASANDITSSGGGISNAGKGTMDIENSTVENNVSEGGQGGGFSDENNVGTLLMVKNSHFVHNSAALDGGAIQEGGPKTTITNTEFTGNFSGANGGALFANGTTLTVSDNSTFTNNTASANNNIKKVSGNGHGGGAIEIETTGTATITDTKITDNQALNNAGANGGGIDVGSGSLTLVNDTINGNFADNGGGIAIAKSGTLTVSGSTFTSNSASVDGGGIDNFGTLTVDRSTFTSDSATFGGGLANESGGTATVSNSTFTNNSASVDGGAIKNFGKLTQSGNTFTGNTPNNVS